MSVTSIELVDWINPEWLSNDRLKTIHTQYQNQKPFRYVVLKDFFSEQAYKNILHHVPTVPLSDNVRYGVTQEARLKWGPWTSKDMIRFCMGTPFRSFIGSIVGKNVFPKKGFVPQLNVFAEGSKGFEIHNDGGEQKDLVSLFQLSEGYQPGKGGELAIHEQIGPNKYVQTDQVPPYGNTLILFEVVDHSYHSVNDLKGNWNRRVICWDWNTKQ